MLRKRFDVGPDAGESLEGAQRRFSVTRERIRAIEAKALRERDNRRPPDDDEW